MKKLIFWKYRGFTTEQVKVFVDGNEARVDRNQIFLRFTLLIVTAVFLKGVGDVNIFGTVFFVFGLIGAFFAGNRYKFHFSRAESFRYMFTVGAIGSFFLMIAEVRLLYRALNIALPSLMIVLLFHLIILSIVFAYYVYRVDHGYGNGKRNKEYIFGYVVLFTMYLFSDSLFGYRTLYLVQGVILLIASLLLSFSVKYLICYRLLLNESRGYYDGSVSAQSQRNVRGARTTRNKAVRNTPNNRYATDGGNYQEAQPRYQTGISPQVQQVKPTSAASQETNAPEQASSFRKADGTMDFDAALANINSKINALGERFNETVASEKPVQAEPAEGNDGNGFPDSVVPGQLERASDETKR